MRLWIAVGKEKPLFGAAQAEPKLHENKIH